MRRRTRRKMKIKFKRKMMRRKEAESRKGVPTLITGMKDQDHVVGPGVGLEKDAIDQGTEGIGLETGNDLKIETISGNGQGIGPEIEGIGPEIEGVGLEIEEVGPEIDEVGPMKGEEGHRTEERDQGRGGPAARIEVGGVGLLAVAVVVVIVTES